MDLETFTPKAQKKFWAELRNGGRLYYKIEELIRKRVLKDNIVIGVDATKFDNKYATVYPQQLKFYGTLNEREKMEYLADSLFLLYSGTIEQKDDNIHFKGEFWRPITLCEFEAEKYERSNFNLNHRRIKRRKNQGRFSLSCIKINMNYDKSAELLDGLVKIMKN